VDTTGVPAAEVARLVRDCCRDWPGFRVVREQPSAASAGPDRTAGSEADGSGGQVLLLCGPVGVGKSTIGFQLYLRCVRAGLTAGYIDLDQIGFLTPHPDDDPRNHRLKAQNLAGIWRTYHAAGARHLVMTGPSENQAVLHAYVAALPDAYVAALPAAMITTCRLHAGPAELRQRIMTRGEGGSWPQPGDPLGGQPASYLSRVAEQVAADAQALDRTPLDAPRIDTDGHTAGEAADLTASAAGWPRQGRGPEVLHHAEQALGYGPWSVGDRVAIRIRRSGVAVGSLTGTVGVVPKDLMIGDQKHPAVEGDPALPRDGQGDVRGYCRSEASVDDAIWLKL
jgi:hypothetical protein